MTEHERREHAQLAYVRSVWPDGWTRLLETMDEHDRARMNDRADLADLAVEMAADGMDPLCAPALTGDLAAFAAQWDANSRQARVLWRYKGTASDLIAHIAHEKE